MSRQSTWTCAIKPSFLIWKMDRNELPEALAICVCVFSIEFFDSILFLVEEILDKFFCNGGLMRIVSEWNHWKYYVRNRICYFVLIVWVEFCTWFFIFNWKLLLLILKYYLIKSWMNNIVYIDESSQEKVKS